MGQPERAQLGECYGVDCCSKGEHACSEPIDVQEVVANSTNPGSKRIGREADVGSKERRESHPPNEAAIQQEEHGAGSNKDERPSTRCQITVSFTRSILFIAFIQPTTRCNRSAPA